MNTKELETVITALQSEVGCNTVYQGEVLRGMVFKVLESNREAYGFDAGELERLSINHLAHRGDKHGATDRAVAGEYYAVQFMLTDVLSCRRDITRKILQRLEPYKVA